MMISIRIYMYYFLLFHNLFSIVFRYSFGDVLCSSHSEKNTDTCLFFLTSAIPYTDGMNLMNSLRLWHLFEICDRYSYFLSHVHYF